MGADDGAIDQGVFEVGFACQSLEDALEHTRHRPASETLERAVPIAKIARQVTPRQSCANPPQHSFKEETVVTRGPPAT